MDTSAFACGDSCSPTIPRSADKRGTNDETGFRAVVSCLVEDQAGHVVTANVTTAGFPAMPSGNSDIDTDLQLP